MFATSPTFRQLYDKAKEMKLEREAELMRNKQPDPRLAGQVSELNKIMDLLVYAFKMAGPQPKGTPGEG
ncbi:hypothetical protein [Tellurirhabdus rosea]|uniref:hypothetical protein n=1 Tax=Tellurirhabdus rosea TaxID=2674997 RepID=UPI00225C105D|nr:hypothetical protein [Tellurirhabdus rosea]